MPLDGAAAETLIADTARETRARRPAVASRAGVRNRSFVRQPYVAGRMGHSLKMLSDVYAHRARHEGVSSEGLTLLSCMTTDAET